MLTWSSGAHSVVDASSLRSEVFYSMLGKGSGECLRARGLRVIGFLSCMCLGRRCHADIMSVLTDMPTRSLPSLARLCIDVWVKDNS